MPVSDKPSVPEIAASFPSPPPGHPQGEELNKARDVLIDAATTLTALAPDSGDNHYLTVAIAYLRDAYRCMSHELTGEAPG